MKKDLKIVLTNYLALIDSILAQTHIHERGAVIRLKKDRQVILRILGDLEYD